jgi:WD40 repeat protein
MAFLACTGSGNTIDLRDAATHALVGTLRSGHQEPPNAFTFSPDGSKLASGASNVVLVWELDGVSEVCGADAMFTKPVTLGPVREISISGRVSALCFNHAGDRIACRVWGYGDSKRISDKITVINTTNCLCLWTVKCCCLTYSAIYFDTADQWVISSTFGSINSEYDNVISCWNVSSGTKLWDAPVYEEHEYRPANIKSFAVSPSSSSVAVATGKSVILFDWPGSKSHLALSRQSHFPYCVIFDDSGERLISGSMDGSVVTWNAVSGVQLLSFHCNSSIISIAYNSQLDHIACSVATVPRARIFNCTTGESVGEVECKGFRNIVCYSPCVTILL